MEPTDELTIDEKDKRRRLKAAVAYLLLFVLVASTIGSIWSLQAQRNAVADDARTAVTERDQMKSAATEANDRLRDAGQPTVPIPSATATAPVNAAPSVAPTIIVRDGQDGTDGEDGATGKRGKAGEDGTDGAPGRPPTAQEIASAVAAYCAAKSEPCKGDRGDKGKDGTDGANGADGQNAELPSGYVMTVFCDGGNLIVGYGNQQRRVYVNACAPPQEVTPSEEPTDSN